MIIDLPESNKIACAERYQKGFFFKREVSESHKVVKRNCIEEIKRSLPVCEYCFQRLTHNKRLHNDMHDLSAAYQQ